MKASAARMKITSQTVPMLEEPLSSCVTRGVTRIEGEGETEGAGVGVAEGEGVSDALGASDAVVSVAILADTPTELSSSSASSMLPWR